MEQSLQKVLTENDIKRVTLRYLKGYYKYRPRKSNTELSSDMRGKGGIIADGFLRFTKEDDTDFTATFEATSYDTRDEVRFNRLRTLLIWDAVAVSSVTTAIIFVIAQLRAWLNFSGADFWLPFLLFTSWITFFFSYFLIMGRWRRYRYIYAIEQFKQYHADEQWIAIGEDVFSFSGDPYLFELKQQCVRNGFGLLIISKEEEPLLQITPSRQELFGSQRQLISFISQNELTRRLQSDQYEEWLKRLDNWFNSSTFANLQRYRKRYMYQVITTTMSILVISAVLLLRYNDKPTNYVNQKRYVEVVGYEELLKNPRSEPQSYVIDTPFLYPLPLMILSDREAIAFDFDPIMDVSESVMPQTEIVPPDDVPASILPKRKAPRPDQDILANNSETNTMTIYDCERFYNFTAPKYIVMEGMYESFEATNRRVSELNRKGFEASGLWLGCFRTADAKYAVYFGLLYNDMNEAAEEADLVIEEAEEQRMEISLRILSIVPDIK